MAAIFRALFGGEIDFEKAVLKGSNFHGVKPRHINIRDADLSESDLGQLDLTHAQVNAGTILRGANVEDTIVDRYTLERLENYGGLTVGDRMRMKIQDGTATLRASFSGFLSLIHVSALLLFLYPTLTLFSSTGRKPSLKIMPIHTSHY